MKNRTFIALLLGATATWMVLLLLIFTWPDPKPPDLGPERSAVLDAFLAHFLLFAVLGVLVSYDLTHLKGRGRSMFVLSMTLLVGATWGGLTEMTQILVPQRDASLSDLFTDVVGTGTGGATTIGVCRLVRFPVYRT